MAGDYLRVTTDALHDTGVKYGKIATTVSGLYENVAQSIDSITSKNSWQGESAIAYQDAFKTISAEFKARLAELNELGPRTMRVAQGYQETEEENTASSRRLV